MVQAEKYINQYEYQEDDTPKDNLLISVVIPLYNEEKSIRNVINRIPNHYEYEIIIVDDGSTDDSVQVVKACQRKVILIEHEENQGYGAALLTGIKNATGDIVITMDSDGQHVPEEIIDLIQPILRNQADIVVGSRYLGKCNYKVPFHTRMGEFIIKTSMQMLFRQSIKNNQSGFRAFSKKTLKIFDNIHFLGMGFTTEILFEAAFSKYKLMEIPTTVNSREFGISYVNVKKVLISVCSCFVYYSLKLFLKKTRLRNLYDQVFYLFRDKVFK